MAGSGVRHDEGSSFLVDEIPNATTAGDFVLPLRQELVVELSMRLFTSELMLSTDCAKWV